MLCVVLLSTGEATPLIDIHDVEHVTLINVTVSSLQPAKPNAVWPQLPYSGIAIKTLAGGVPIITLDGVTAAKTVDGIRVVGGGNLSAHNLRSSYNHNMGLYYMCSMMQQSSLVVTGKTTIAGNGGAGVPIQEGEDERGVGEQQHIRRRQAQVVTRRGPQLARQDVLQQLLFGSVKLARYMQVLQRCSSAALLTCF
jgi:hypothetical protein